MSALMEYRLSNQNSWLEPNCCVIQVSPGDNNVQKTEYSDATVWQHPFCPELSIMRAAAPEVVPFARHTVHVPVSYALEGCVRYSDTKKCTRTLCSRTTQCNQFHSPPASGEPSGWDTAPQMHFNHPIREKEFPWFSATLDFSISIFCAIERARGGAWLETHADERCVMSLEGKSNNLWLRLKSD